jgi:RNA-directed DNA polymerase
LTDSSDVEIIETYNAELRGLANYYSLAYDVKMKLSRLQYLSNYSLTKTLANKHKTKMSRILKQLRQGNEWKYRYKVGGNDREVKVFKLNHMNKPRKQWKIDMIPNTHYLTSTRSELVKRLNAGQCEYCGRDDLSTQVHHVKKLKDLRKKPNLEHWQEVLIARNRKTMILCSGTPDSCHTLLHVGKLPDKRFNSKWI